MSRGSSRSLIEILAKILRNQPSAFTANAKRSFTDGVHGHLNADVLSLSSSGHNRLVNYMFDEYQITSRCLKLQRLENNLINAKGINMSFASHMTMALIIFGAVAAISIAFLVVLISIHRENTDAITRRKNRDSSV